jgi:glycine/D-amino acid oxidase-like deaminating enzyme
MPPTQQRIAILGGGLGSLIAAYELTSTSELLAASAVGPHGSIR